MVDAASNPPPIGTAPASGNILARVFRAITGPTKAEGDIINQPMARVMEPEEGWIPMNWPLNFWQSGYNVIPSGDNAIVDACVWAYIRAIAQLPGFHRRRETKEGFGENEVTSITTSALSRLLRFPNTYETRSDFLTHTVRSLLYTGNSYWLATHNQRNEVDALHWLNARFCKPYVAENGDIFYSCGDNPIL